MADEGCVIETTVEAVQLFTSVTVTVYVFTPKLFIACVAAEPEDQDQL